MEVYELPITTEESRNYHKFMFKLKALNVIDWTKAYITALFCSLLIFMGMLIFCENVMLIFWFKTNILAKVVLFLLFFLGSALQRSKSVQLRAMLQKYFINNMPQEFLGGSVQLKKIKVQGDRILVYYRKFKS
jgi:hypothetical protein